MKIVVLGSGVIGVTSAWYLAKAGHEVTVIDRQPEAARPLADAALVHQMTPHQVQQNRAVEFIVVGAIHGCDARGTESLVDAISAVDAGLDSHAPYLLRSGVATFLLCYR